MRIRGDNYTRLVSSFLANADPQVFACTLKEVVDTESNNHSEEVAAKAALKRAAAGANGGSNGAKKAKKGSSGASSKVCTACNIKKLKSAFARYQRVCIACKG